MAAKRRSIPQLPVAVPVPGPWDPPRELTVGEQDVWRLIVANCPEWMLPVDRLMLTMTCEAWGTRQDLLEHVLRAPDAMDRRPDSVASAVLGWDRLFTGGLRDFCISPKVARRLGLGPIRTRSRLAELVAARGIVRRDD
jgi:hypothetical protein